MARTDEQIQAIESQMARNAEYWQQRYARLENATHISANEYISQLDRQYKLANRSIKSKLASFYLQFADNEGISLSEAKRLLTEDQLAEFHMSVEEYIKLGQGPDNMDPDVQKLLERASIKYRVTRLEAIETELAAELEQLRLKSQNITFSAVSNAYRERYYRSIYEIQKGIGVGSTFSKVDENKLKKILDQSWVADGLNFSDRIWKNKANLYDEMTKSLSQALILGQGYAETSEKFQKRMGVSFNSASRLIVTESAYYSSVAQQDSFKELNVNEYEIVATLDHVTSEICRYMDGKVFKMSDFKAGVTAPPFHVNCRTSTCPHFDDSDLKGYTVGERAARNEAEGETYYVPADLDYDKWYDQYVLRNNKVKDPKINIKMGKLGSQLPKDDYDSIKDYVDNAPVELKKFWNKYVDGIDFGDINYSDDHYDCIRKKIYMNVVKARKPRVDWNTFDPIENPSEPVFHEMGHNFDHLVSQDKGKRFSSSYFTDSNNGKADKLIEKDYRSSLADYMMDHFDEFYPKKLTTAQITSIDRADSTLKSLAIQYRKGEINRDELLANEKVKLGLASKRNIQVKLRRDFIAHINNTLTFKERFDLSDIFEKHLKKSRPFGGGHGLSYWKYHTPAVEAFAEIFAAYMTNDVEAITTLEKYTPNLIDYFWEMIRGVNGTN